MGSGSLPEDEPLAAREVGFHGDGDGDVCGGGGRSPEMGVCGGGFDPARPGAKDGGTSRATNAKAAGRFAARKGAVAAGGWLGRFDVGWMASAGARAGLGPEENRAKPGGMARTKDRGVLLAGA